jgi:hypothetical protein
MDAAVFRARVAPLLDPDTLRALRCVSRDWQWVVDQLLEVKGAFLWLQDISKLTAADVRFAHLHMSIAAWVVLEACAGGELADLQWALRTFSDTSLSERDTGRVLERVTRTECMALLLREHWATPVKALQCSCSGGHLNIAQWLTSTFNLDARDARADSNLALRRSCSRGQLVEAQWLTSTFGLTADDARADDNYALLNSCAIGHLAVAEWLTSTFGLTADDARAEGNFALHYSRQRAP